MIKENPMPRLSNTYPTFIDPTDSERKRILDKFEKEERLVREKERRTITSISRPTWDRMDKGNSTPKRVAIGDYMIAWRLSDLYAWVEQMQQNS